MPRNTAMFYVYTALDETKSEIRLLKLNPSLIPASTVRCDILYASLNDKPEYLALSYVWGSKENPASIRLGGKQKLVTRNLLEALQGIRRKTSSITIWIDALCINQDNNDEKSSQVRLMGQLYTQAREVLVWLGPKKQDTHLAIDMIKKWSTFELPTGIDAPIATAKKFTEESASFDPKVWAALYDILEREWWSRIWTYQESVLAHTPTLICGPYRMTWRQLTVSVGLWKYMQADRFIHLLANEGLELLRNCPFSAASQMVMHGSLKKGRVKAGTQPIKHDLVSLVHTLRDHKAGDPRDKIYALLDVAERPRLTVDVDYNLPVRQVYTDFLRTVFREKRTLNLLASTVLRESALTTATENE